MIVGLGNPGKKYENTHHNIGFMVLKCFPGNISWQNKFNALYCKQTYFQEDVLLVMPQTYMNLSGDSVIRFANYFKIAPKDILVIQDDLDLPFGNYRLKYISSSGGHNGIKSIIANLGTDHIPRLKIGIGRSDNISTIDYVLDKLSIKEQKILNDNMSNYHDIINDFIKTDINHTMLMYNKK